MASWLRVCHSGMTNVSFTSTHFHWNLYPKSSILSNVLLLQGMSQKPTNFVGFFCIFVIHSDFPVCFVKLLHKVGLNLSLFFSNMLSSNLKQRRESKEQKIRGFRTSGFSLNSLHAVSGSFHTCYLPFSHSSPWKSTASQVSVN